VDEEDTPGEPSGPEGHAHDPHHPFRDAGHTLADAAIEAEMATGRHEETLEEARAGVTRRMLRATGGFLLIGIGIVLLPLPGPGWVVIILGLSLLPFAWAERTILAIRRRVPGVPDEGAVPLSTWIIMGVMVVAATTIFILFGGAIGRWLSDAWSGVWE
jgi:hypothetical protein